LTTNDTTNAGARPRSFGLIAVKSISLLLGGLFVVAGLGKVFALAPFALTISALTHLSAAEAKLLAMLVVVLELSGGIALLLRFRVVIVSILFCGLLGFFIRLLLVAVLEGRAIDCNCFGILNVGLSNRGEIVLDLVLVNLLILLLILVFQSRGRAEQGRSWWVIGLTLVIAVEYSLFSPLLKQGAARQESNVLSAISYAETRSPAFASCNGNRRLLFLLRFADFNCPPCFESFIDLADSLRMRLKEGDQHCVLALFAADDVANPANPFRLHRWAQSNEFPFPMVIVPDTLFSQNGIFRSSVAVIGFSNVLLLQKQFPLREGERQIVLGLLDEEGYVTR
jgi:hypothetical protein